MIDLRPGIHYHALCFVYPATAEFALSRPHIGIVDLFGGSYRTEDGVERLMYRFAYYDHPDQPRDEARTSWYSSSCAADRPFDVSAALATIKKVCELTALRNHSRYDLRRIDGDLEKLLRTMQGADWWHRRECNDRDAEELHRAAIGRRLEQSFRHDPFGPPV